MESKQEVTIYSNNHISINGKTTGYTVSQMQEGTIVAKTNNNGYPLPKDLGDVVELPQKRYALSHKEGKAAFDKDLLAIWNSK
jgi:hypothetical protein